jgi:hypothetical protein
LLVLWCAGGRCDKVGRDEDRVGYSMVGRSGGRVIPCAVCTVHVEIRSTSFLVEPQNQDRQFDSDLASKPLGHFFGLALKPMTSDFPVYASKPTATVW